MAWVDTDISSGERERESNTFTVPASKLPTGVFILAAKNVYGYMYDACVVKKTTNGNITIMVNSSSSPATVNNNSVTLNSTSWYAKAVYRLL